MENRIKISERVCRMIKKSRRHNKNAACKYRKAIFFSIDSLVAATLIIFGLILVSSFYISEKQATSINYLSSDIIWVLSELKIKEVNNSYVSSLIANGTIPDVSLNNSLAEVIGEMWATNKTDIAANLSMIFIDPYISGRYGYGVYVDDEEIISRSNPLTSASLAGQKMISGIEKDKAILGYSTKAYLSSIKDRTTSSVVTFGGFEGEGNITKRLMLPHEFNITSAYLELEAGTDFRLYVNGNLCQEFPLGSGNGSYMVPDRWDINISNESVCNKSYFVPGVNNLSFRFEHINENFTADGPNYIAGGFFRVNYVSRNTTDLEVRYINDSAISRYYFPGIEGFINHYSSFYVPGNLSEMKLNMSFFSNYSVFLRIGNITVYEDNPFGNASLYLNSTQLEEIFSNHSVNYTNLSLKTIPLRFGLKNVSTVNAPVDIVLTTDISGSMNWRLDNNNNGVTRDCNDSQINDPSTRRISGARCAAKAMVDDVLANEGPEVGLVAYEQATDDIFNLSDNTTALKNEIDSYVVGGGTCICCGVRDAVNMLIQDQMTKLITSRTPGWKYNDNDLSSPPSGWTNLSFNDASWSTGTSVFRNTYNSLGSPRTIINRYAGDYYFRKKFNITNTSEINDAKLYVLSDAGADIYLNGQLIDNDYSSTHTAFYWNRNAIDVNESLFVEGENIIAARLRNELQCWLWWCWDTDVAFDLELAISKDNVSNPRNKAIIVMSDGEANYRCNGAYDVSEAKEDAINESCEAYDKYGIRTFTVGFGYSADRDTLESMANCSDGQYYNSTSVDELIEAYKQISQYLVEFSSAQTVNYSNIYNSYLYPESHLEFNYSPIITPPSYGKIPITVQSPRFGNNISEGSIYIPTDVDLVDLSVTSYSADRWASYVNLSNSNGLFEIYNLSSYNTSFHEMGDAYEVNVPVNLVTKGENNIIDSVTGFGPINNTGGSSYNRFMYTVIIDGLLDFSGVYPKNWGCNWSLNFEDGSNSSVLVPPSYNGTKNCNYLNSVYDSDDASDEAAYRLFQRLDFDDDGYLEVRLDETNLLIDSLSIEEVPSMWGPAILEVRVWQ